MSIWMAGVDHTKADLDVRSVFSFTKKRIEDAYTAFKQVPGVEGCVMVATCNRMELWFSVSHKASFSPVELLCDHIGVRTERYAPFFAVREDREAVDHLFRVASGIESRILGEDQIITQVGDALAFARGCYAADRNLEVLFRQAITAAKRVKTESGLSATDQSVIHNGLRKLRDQGVDVAGKKCMVIGNGMMGRISAQALLDQGAEVTVTVRQYHSGVVDIPRGCERIGYDKRLEFLPGCDLVVSATSSPNYTLKAEDLAALQVDHPILLIDLAVPRDIDPNAAGLDWVTLYDIDSFRIERISDRQKAAIERAQLILNEEEDKFYVWYEGRDFVPQIQRIKAVAGSDVSARLTPALRRARLGDEKRSHLAQEVEGASERMMNHLLHGMRSRLPDDTFRECMDAMESVLSEIRKQ